MNHSLYKTYSLHVTNALTYMLNIYAEYIAN